MRLLRELDAEQDAQYLVDALADSGIETDLKSGQDGRHRVWVLDESQLPRAQQLSSSWLDQGQRETLESTSARGRAARELKEHVEQRRRRQLEAATRQLAAYKRPRPAPLTWGLVFFCIAIAALTQLGKDRAMVGALTIADPLNPPG